MKHYLLSTILWLSAITASAYNIGPLNNLYYNILSASEVQVTYVELGEGNKDFYYGDIVIPKYISYNNQKYTVTSVGPNAFDYCSGITSVTFPETLFSIGNFSFRGCTGIQSVNIPESVEYISWGAFDGCTSLSDVTLPSTMSDIDGQTFQNCSSLKAITLPENLTAIKSWLFANCSSLETINIPASVTTIGDGVFQGCNNLSTVTVNWKKPVTLGNDVFTNSKDIVLYVPENSKHNYTPATNWKDFKAIIEMVEFSEEVYFLQNIGTGKFLNKGGEFNVHAVLSDEAIPILLSKQDDYSYVMIFPEGWYVMFRGDDGNVWTDYSWDGSCINWNFTRTGQNTYQIQTYLTDPRYGQTDEFLGNDSKRGDNVDGNVKNIGGTNILWRLIPVSEYHSQAQAAELQRAIVSAKSLGLNVSTAENLLASGTANSTDVENATGNLKNAVKKALAAGVDEASLPIDITCLINNPSFDRNDNSGWQGDNPGFEQFFNAEFFEKECDIYQMVMDLPNGKYLLKVNGFHRPGSPWDVYADYMQGNDKASAILYANGSKTTLKNIASAALDEPIEGWCGMEVSYDGKAQFIPNNMRHAKYWFDQGYYENIIVFTVTDGKATIGIKCDDAPNQNWVMFDDFRLAYLGTNYADIAEGTYYLQNAETGQYLYKAWGTAAILDDEAMPLRAIRQGDGSYALFITHESDNQQLLFRNDDADVYINYWGQEDACPYWSITKNTDGTYCIRSLVSHEKYGQKAMPGTFLGNNAADNWIHVTANVTEGESHNIKWRFVPESNYLMPSHVAKLKQAIACAKPLGINTKKAKDILDKWQGTYDEIEEAIGHLLESCKAKIKNGVDKNILPLDMTALITNASFMKNNADGWEWADDKAPGVAIWHTAEYFQEWFNFHQTLTGLPNGTYVVKAKAYQRPGNRDKAYSDYKKGVNDVTAVLYANNYSTPINNIAAQAQNTLVDGWSGVEVTSSGKKQFLPDTMYDAEAWFSNGLYDNQLTFTVDKGTATFGIKSDVTRAEDWVIFSDFRLYYHSASTATPVGIDTMATDGETVKRTVYNLQGQRITAPQRGINVIGGKKFVVR